MHKIKKQNYSLNLVLSNKYMEVIIQCLLSKIFNEKIEVLFYKIKIAE